MAIDRSLRATLLVVALTVASGSAQAQHPDARTRAVDSLFTGWAKSGTPGCGVGVIRDGQFVYRADYGTADLARGTPIRAGTTYYMASVSKQFAAAAVALASLQGHLSLDDEVRKYVPELPAYATGITVRHLVHHTSGLRDYLGLLGLAGRLDAVHDDDAVVHLIGQQRALNFPAGSRYSYSNSGYMLLSVVLKRATGRSLRAFTQQEMFGPLGMRDTYFYDDHTAPHPAGDRRAIGYQPARGNGFESGVFSNFEQVGDGGLFSTVEDVLRWDQNFYDGRVGGPRFLDLIHSTGRLTDGTSLEYAFGLQVTSYGGLRLVTHGGSFMGYRTVIHRFPDQRFSTVVLCNLGTASPEQLGSAIADIYLADALHQAQQEFAGDYRSDELDIVRRISIREGRLFVHDASGEIPLRSQGKDVYVMRGATIRFTRQDGRVNGFDLDQGVMRGLRFDRQ